MFQFIGYSFFSDQNALNQAPGNVDNITSTRISNAIFDHFNVTKDTTIPPSTNLPGPWDYDTIMDADFNGDLNAGNVDFMIEEISAIKIKRRIQGTFDWITLATIPVDSIEDLTFVFNDYLNIYGTQYDYAFVPIFGPNVEGSYIINTILSQFNGVFIGDSETIYKFFYDVQYGTNARTQQVGTFQPLGRQFPVVVANGELSYDTGTVSGSILNDDFDKTGQLDYTAIVQKKNQIKDYLTNKKAKILKDWRGNAWLCMVIDNPQVTYKAGSGLGIPQAQFNWVEIGDLDNQQDLYNNGLVSEVN